MEERDDDDGRDAGKPVGGVQETGRQGTSEKRTAFPMNCHVGLEWMTDDDRAARPAGDGPPPDRMRGTSIPAPSPEL